MIIYHVSSLDRIQHHTGRSKTPLTHIEIQTRISDFIDNVIKEMGENDFLLAFGDHGTAWYGGHGGRGEEESHTFLFAYTKQKVKRLISPSIQTIHPDVATTLAMIYDIPIPKNSVGVPIFLP